MVPASMQPDDERFPSYPPGFWRRIDMVPFAGHIIAGLEDDAHRFFLRVSHDGALITDVTARADRFPWSTCPGAAPFLSEQLTGRTLEDVAALDPTIHCTHLYDLAVIAAAHAGAPAPVRFDMQVADRVDARTTATLFQDGQVRLQWRLNDTEIEGPGEWAGRNLKKLSVWKQELPPETALWAAMLRRAAFVSGVRRQPEFTPGQTADRGPLRIGACFTYQLPRARDATRSTNWRRDFSQSPDAPLRGFPAN